MIRIAAALAAALAAAPALGQVPTPPQAPAPTQAAPTPAVPTPGGPPPAPALVPDPALEPLRAQARESLADLQLATAMALPVYREAALALIDAFFVIPDVPLEEAADQLMIYLMLPEDRRDPRFALLGQAIQTWPALAQRAAEAGVPLPYWAARRFDRIRLVRAACIMWGRGPIPYRAPAERAGVPAELGERCQALYRDVTRRWDGLLERTFAADTDLRPGRGVVSVDWDVDLPDSPGLRALRENATLEMVAEQLTRDFSLPVDMTIAVHPCPELELSWQRDASTLRLCSGLVEAFDRLIRPAYAAQP